MSLKPYPEYKDSGAPWLGKVPKHWQVLPNRALFAEVNDRNHPQEPLLSVTIGKGVIRQTDLLADTSKKDSSNKNKANYKLVQPRDIAYNKMRAWQGAVGVSNYRGIVSPAYIVVRPRGDQNPEYFHYLLRTPAFAKEAERWSYGITSDQWSLRAEDFKQVYCALPPKEEQDTIVAFLAQADRRINRRIRAKQRLIELLNEQKQAIIHRAVTRGLVPNVRLKPSGISWISDVPEDWEVAQLGRFLQTVEQGWSPVAAEGDADEDQWAVVTLSAVKKGGFYPGENKPLPRSMDVPRGLELQQGDFLLTRSNTRSLVGDVCVVEHTRPKLMLCDLIYRLRLDTRHLHPRFLMYQLLSPCGRAQIEADARGSSSTMVKLSHRHIKRWAILQPPPDVQENIAAHLDGVSAEIASLIHRAYREINLLREYRTRLIADVVTGKLDVRRVELPAMDAAEALDDIDTTKDAEADEMNDSEEALE